MRENLFELDINSHEQRLLLGVKGFRKKMDRKILAKSDTKRLQEVQMKIRDAMALRSQYFTWGLTDLVIQFRLKIRATEDLIECAQRLQVRADDKTERELAILKQLRDRTYEDIRFFVNEREKKIWRLWENYGGLNYKPLSDSSSLTLN